MSKLIKYGTFFSFLGMLIIFIHSITPHEHNELSSLNNQIEISSDYDSFSDFILLDIGIAHLENINLEDIYFLLAPFEYTILSKNNIYISYNIINNNDISYLPQLLSQNISHRGPPLI